MVPDGQFMPGDILPPSTSPDSMHNMHSEEQFLSNGPGRPMVPPFSSASSLPSFPGRPEMTSEVW